MVPVGIFARTFLEPTLDQVLDAVASHNIDLVHFNLRCAGINSLVDEVDDDLCKHIRKEFKKRHLEMIAVSGTYNLIDPDVIRRKDLTQGVCRLIERANDLGTNFITLCTGTYNPENMWEAHPDNNSPQAWRDMLASLEKLVTSAESHRVTLGIEPEPSNVINTAAKARQLLDQMQTKHLKIVIDGANLLTPENFANMQEVLIRAFDLLGPDIAMAHAKEIPNDPSISQQGAGKGRLDWHTYFQCMNHCNFRGPIVLHNLGPSQVGDSFQFIKRLADQYYSNISN